MNKKILPVSIALLAAAGSLYTPLSLAEGMALEEIIVSARKKQESLQDVPVVVSALSSQMIERYNLNTIEDVAGLTPGFQVAEGSLVSGSVITMRGIGTAQISFLADQAISFAVDGFSIGHGALSRVSQFDIAQIEILKGPQALFFGKNSPGGVVSYTSADPTGEFELQLGTGYETKSGDQYYQGVVSGPLSETLGGRLAVRYNDKEGWLKNTAVADPDFVGGGASFSTGAASKYNSSTEQFVRGTLVWEPTDSFSMRTKYTYNESELDYASFATAQRIFCPTGVGRGSAPDCDIDFEAPAHRAPQEHRDILAPFAGKNNDFTKTEMKVLTNEINWEISDNWNLTAITGYFDGEDIYAGSIDNGTLFSSRTATQSVEQQHFSQEVRLASDFDGPVNVTVGGLWGDAEQTAEVLLAVFNVPVPVLGPSPQPKTIDTTTKSVFAQVDWEITDQVSLTTGARWTQEEKDFSASEGGVPVTTLTSTSETFHDVSPEATLTWRPMDNITLFAAYKEGFKSGGFNTLLVPGGFVAQGLGAPDSLYDVTYEPETAKGFEIGAKTEWLDNRLRVNAAIFDYEYKNLQLGRFEPATNALTVVNASSLVARGAEMDALYISDVIEGLTLRGAIAFLDSEFGDYSNAPCYEGQSIQEGCNLQFGVVENRFLSQDLSGTRAAYAPEWTHSWGFTYERPAMEGWSWSLSADAIYSDSFTLEQAQTPGVGQDAYWKYNAALALMSDDDAWNLTLTGRNLTDEVVVGTAFSSTGTGAGTGEDISGAVRADINGRVSRGREVWLELNYTFH